MIHGCLMRHSGFLALFLILGMCLQMSCSSAPRSQVSAGPDATVSQLPDSAVSDQWPSDSLQFVVSRPSYEPGEKGRMDPRTTLAVVDPDRATWIMASRMDDRQGLELTGQLEDVIVLRTRDEVASENADRMEALILMRPEEGQSSRILSGGQWEIIESASEAGEDANSTIVLAIRDQNGPVAATVEMDIPTARDLLLRLSSAIRAPG